MVNFCGVLCLLLLPVLAAGQQLKIRVDDDFAVYQDGEEILNTHTIPGWQWENAYGAELTSNLLIVTAFNQGGPGGILLTVDGEGIAPDQWRCNSMASQSQQPEDAYPGVLSADFDDSAWLPAISMKNFWGATDGFPEGLTWFWASQLQSKMVICRTTLEPCSRQLSMWSTIDIPVDKPELTDDCKFVARQCNEEKCFCVNADTGAQSYGGLEVPIGEPYDCSSMPSRCLQERFEAGDGFMPSCTHSGEFVKKQCYNGECWCVRPNSGKEVKNTRNRGDVTCI